MQRFSDDLFEARFEIIGDAGERAFGFLLAKAHQLERLTGLRPIRGDCGRRSAAVARSVGVREAEPRRRPTLDEQLPAVIGSMMRRA